MKIVGGVTLKKYVESYPMMPLKCVPIAIKKNGTSYLIVMAASVLFLLLLNCMHLNNCFSLDCRFDGCPVGTACNTTTGSCICSPNYYGQSCNICMYFLSYFLCCFCVP